MGEEQGLPKHCLLFLGSRFPHGQIYNSQREKQRDGVVLAGKTESNSVYNLHSWPLFIIHGENCQTEDFQTRLFRSATGLHTEFFFLLVNYVEDVLKNVLY